MNNTFSLKTKILLILMALSVTACGMTTPPPTTTNTLSTADQGVQPTDSGCAQEGHIKSPSSYDAATVTFDNQTAGDVKVYWLDFNGARQFYSTLKAHAKYDQATWIGHVWVVADASDKCMKLESANAVEQTLVIN